MPIDARRNPAILGGNPAFEEKVPINSPTLPPVDKLQKPLNEIFSTGQLTNGRYVEELENRCAEYLGSKYAVALSSCTLGLILVLQALGMEGEVLLPSFTFSATGHSLLWNNLRPVFVDCELGSYNIDLLSIEKRITGQTSAILAVDVFGNPCDRETLLRIAGEHDLKLIIDCAHSLGSIYRNQQLGGLAEAQVFSLSPTKVVVAGEGGIVITNNAHLAENLRKARNYGDPGNYNCEFAGLNARMAEFNAILGLESLEMVESNVGSRNKLVELYISRLKAIPGIMFQKVAADSRSTYKDFSILIEGDKFGMDRDGLGAALAKENIETRPYFNPPLHKQKAYKFLELYHSSDLPNTEFLSSHALSLPLFAHMPEETVERIYAAIKSIYFQADEVREEMKKRR